jgi:hypothetical protein
MRQVTRGLAALLLALAPVPATAVHCAIDQVPAATLLVPYFEVDLDDPNGATTVFSVTNTSPAAVLAHVTVWTDWGVPALVFDVYLTGHDLQAVSLRDVVAFGNLPVTASLGQDPSDIVSPNPPGSLPSQDVNHPSCAGVLPYAGPLTAGEQADLRAMLTGAPIPSSGLCAGSPYGDDVARGYVTVDVSSGCSSLDPTSEGYFGAGGIALDDNVLTGDVWVVDLTADSGFAYPVVHLEAGSIPSGSPSFYARYVGDTAVDGREPLPSRFATRFDVADSSAATQLMIWRESGTPSVPVACGSDPAWAPLSTRPVLLIDDATTPANAPASLPTAAGVLDLASDLTNPFPSGLAILDLDHGGFAGRRAQGYVLARTRSSGALDEEYEPFQAEDACTGSRFFHLIFRDGFELGFDAWSWASPPPGQPVP